MTRIGTFVCAPPKKNVAKCDSGTLMSVSLRTHMPRDPGASAVDSNWRYFLNNASAAAAAVTSQVPLMTTKPSRLLTTLFRITINVLILHPLKYKKLGKSFFWCTRWIAVLFPKRLSISFKIIIIFQ